MNTRTVRSAKDYFFRTVATPVGQLRIVASDLGVAAILWENDDPGRVPFQGLVEDSEHPALLEAATQLGEYFGGVRTAFELRLDFAGTEFQKKVWHALLTIPFGETRSYADIARKVGSPRAMRAVGAANGRNPISIVAPCHRVIGANGALTGFAGGLAAKKYLLDLEQRGKKSACG